jgi:hypothetical protein
MPLHKPRIAMLLLNFVLWAIILILVYQFLNYWSRS